MRQIKGDLLKLFKEGEFDVIIHGCNCFNVMGAGIAKQIAEKYPKASLADKETLMGDAKKLSNWSTYILPNNQIIINLYTQYLPGKNLNEWALFLGFEKLLNYLLPIGKRIGIPAIGCGIAGGDWNKIFPVLTEIAKKAGHDLITYVEYEKLNKNGTD
jgi:O-acetyl-ADP-ribose deacetylase (regulator of RNase III)